MGLERYVASQLGNPKGWFGRLVMTRLLNFGNQEIIEATLGLLDVRDGDRLLDVGFGGGRALQLAASKIGSGTLTGIDPSADALRFTKQKLRRLQTCGKLELLRLQGEGLAETGARYDKIISTNTVYFWPDIDASLRAIASVLAEDGTVCLGFSGIEKLREYDQISRHGFHFHDENEVAESARACGLSEVELLAQHGRRTTGDVVLRARKRAT